MRHIFCLFDGHGGDSVAEFCNNHLIDHIVDLLRAERGSEDQTGIHVCNGAQGVDAGSGTITNLEGGPAAIAACVKEACRIVDTQAGRKICGRHSGHVTTDLRTMNATTRNPPLSQNFMSGGLIVNRRCKATMESGLTSCCHTVRVLN